MNPTTAAPPVGMAASTDPVQQAREFTAPLLTGHALDTGESALDHADGVALVLQTIGAAPALQAAAYLVYAGDHLQRPDEVLRKVFGPAQAELVALTRKLVQIQRAARGAPQEGSQHAQQTERVRKMLLAFSRDLRVVLLRLASRLQTLKWYAQSKVPCPPELAQESLQVFAPLANRLGIWQIKWELEDLSFRFLQPARYHEVARLVDGKRAVRESAVAAAVAELHALVSELGLEADVQGRPKHLYSIWKKMQGKGLPFARVYDARALRVIVADVPACYAVLARVHEVWQAVEGEFDDYIAKPKSNGYQSLHTVVRLADGQPLEVQVRTRAMHEHAEHGVAAHWMYKEAGIKGYTGVAASGEFEDRVAEARKAVLRELLAWERDFSRSSETADAGNDAPRASSTVGADSATPASAFGDRIYVFTPQTTIIELPACATPVDFAYSVHTELGHRCRGAKVDGVLVPLNTTLQSGQTVAVVTAKEGGPSMDWLNPELGYLTSHRARAKVRAWFNAQALSQTVARGREAVERLLQREGRTAIERQSLAEQLGFKDAEALFEVVGKDELSLRAIENLWRPAEPAIADEIHLRAPTTRTGANRSGVLVVGMDSLLTTLARCCRPAPPDAIAGYVTRGRGVAVHRKTCSNLRQMAGQSGERVIEVEWGQPNRDRTTVYPMDVVLQANDRPGLLRDISDVFVREKMNVISVQTQSDKSRRTAAMTFTVEAVDAARLAGVLAQVAQVPGVRQVRRR